MNNKNKMKKYIFLTISIFYSLSYSQVDTDAEKLLNKVSENIKSYDNIYINYTYTLNNLEELLLLMAARSNHINEVIIPNLKKGKIVISDRYADSSFVYQGYVNKFGIKRAQKFHKELLNNFFPDYTFIFKISPKEIIKRLKQRKVKNKYDKSNLLFHQKVIQGYKKIANPKRYITVDASLSKDIIHKNIIKKLKL